MIKVNALNALADKNHRAFIFDLDGTLVDSENQIHRAILETSRLMDIEELSYAQLHKTLGLPLQAILQPLNLEPWKLAGFTRKFRQLLCEEIKRGNQLFPDAISFLELVKSHDFVIGIATSKPTNLAKLVVKYSDLKSLVDHTQGTEAFLPKPHPRVIFECMRGLKVNTALMIGDRREDMQAAIAANIPGIGLAHSFHQEAELISSGAILAYGSFGEAIKNFDQIVSCFENL